MAGLNPLTHILETSRFTGPNFSNWFRSLKIVLNIERIDDTLSYILLTEIPQSTIEEEIITWEILKEHDMRARNYILASMSNDFQHQFEYFMSVASIIQHLNDLFSEHNKIARHEISKKLF